VEYEWFTPQLIEHVKQCFDFLKAQK
jgi:hypothetical protein